MYRKILIMLAAAGLRRERDCVLQYGAGPGRSI